MPVHPFQSLIFLFTCIVRKLNIFSDFCVARSAARAEGTLPTKPLHRLLGCRFSPRRSESSPAPQLLSQEERRGGSAAAKPESAQLSAQPAASLARGRGRRSAVYGESPARHQPGDL